MDGRAHAFFSDFKIKKLDAATFDDALAGQGSDLVGIFFWGHDCPNCEIAKNTLIHHLAELNALGLKWFDVNVYENMDLGTRFGLMGIPAFIFFRGGRKLGKISPFPGFAPFYEAVAKL